MRQIIILLMCLIVVPLASAREVVAPAAQTIEVAFSPEGGGEALVLKTLRAAKSSIRLAAYSFTSVPVVRALMEAKRRGVDVAILVDDKNNLQEARNNAPRQVLNLLVSAGIATRTISAYPIHHDKYFIVDGRHVETGSFNYTASAAKRNGENVLVIWNNPAIAQQYIGHWQSRWQQGTDYRVTY